VVCVVGAGDAGCEDQGRTAVDAVAAAGRLVVVETATGTVDRVER